MWREGIGGGEGRATREGRRAQGGPRDGAASVVVGRCAGWPEGGVGWGFWVGVGGGVGGGYGVAPLQRRAIGRDGLVGLVGLVVVVVVVVVVIAARRIGQLLRRVVVGGLVRVRVGGFWVGEGWSAGDEGRAGCGRRACAARRDRTESRAREAVWAAGRTAGSRMTCTGRRRNAGRWG